MSIIRQMMNCIIFCTNLWVAEFYLLFLFFKFQSFTGNEDRNSEVKHILYEGVFARYLQFLPEAHQGAVCLRTELFGVKLKPSEYRFIISVHVLYCCWRCDWLVACLIHFVLNATITYSLLFWPRKAWFVLGYTDRVYLGHWKPGRSWNSRISFSRPEKSWKLSIG